MIVVAIIGVLAAVALPAFHGYSKRAKLAEVLLAATGCRTVITEAYMTEAQPSAAANAWGCESSSPSSRFVRSIATDASGRITVTAQGIAADVDGKDVTIYPSDVGGAPLVFGPGSHAIPRWVCGSAAEGTTVSAQYLPASCRGP
jgi:type IV pilus assembly protein PilA